jgi:hypothetical protein
MKERKTEFIIIRVTKSEKDNFIKQAGKNLSKFIRQLIGLDNDTSQ